MNHHKSAAERKAIRDRNPYAGDNPAVIQLLNALDSVATKSSPILLEGETGTGKSLLARRVHDNSERKGRFVSINCATFSQNLLETELFGHTKGAFTGAKEARAGLVASANNGTLFLDEIGELAYDFQAKLLHLLEEKTFRPVGADIEKKTSVRIVAATNRHLKLLVKEGKFRADLFYRLSVLPFTAPPLRDRLDDLEGLSNNFIAQLSEEHGLTAATITPQALKTLKTYHWPGNIRELRNHIERSLLLNTPLDKKPAHQESVQKTSDKSLEAHEKTFILHTIHENNGNKSKAAMTLGISRRTLDRKLKRWKELAA